MKLLPLRTLAFLCAAAASLVGCKTEPTIIDSCRDARDCRAGEVCDVALGRCLCTLDEACEDGEFCNRAGNCQARAGCVDNSGCTQANTFCDILSGECLLGPAEVLDASCGLVSHCPIGSICTTGQCVAGCHDDGDCALGLLCIEGQCTGGEGLCRTDDFCEYQERCVGSQCARERGPYCRGCSPLATPNNPDPCDHPRNFCLVNSAEAGGSPYFCGVDCSLGQPCPNGYGCNGVLILTDGRCRSNVQCRCQPGTDYLATLTSSCSLPAPCDPVQPNGQPDPDAVFCLDDGHAACPGSEEVPGFCLVRRGARSGNCGCATDAECGEGGTCVSGVCCSGRVRTDRSCFANEGAVSGFCSCGTDDDCPTDICDGASSTCALTGLPCTPGNNDCGPLACIDGACLIGQNCAPSEGLACSELTR